MELSKLLTPFDPTEIEWRISRSGLKGGDGDPWAKVLAYVTNRAIMDRLDAVCGPENWRNEYKDAPGGGILCGLSIRCGDEWITKWDGADSTQIEAVKGGLSGAMKRAAVQWGIGRYLYQLEEGFARFVPKGKGQYSSPIKKDKSDNRPKWYDWDPPALPAFAMPDGKAQASADKPDPPQERTEPVKDEPAHVQTFKMMAPEIEKEIGKPIAVDIMKAVRAWNSGQDWHNEVTVEAWLALCRRFKPNGMTLATVGNILSSTTDGNLKDLMDNLADWENANGEADVIKEEDVPF